MIYNSGDNISYRSGADPAVVEFRGEYYMFVTRSHGYWHSKDLAEWEFITPQNWYFEGSNAPAAHNYKDSVLYVTGNPSGNMSILYTDNPKKGDWKSTPGILYDLQDPDLFIDDDGQAYMFWGSSNTYPMRGKKLNKDRHFHPEGETHELFKLDMDKHGWERFGENHADTTLKGYMEGAWLTKHNGKYYMQYAAPGTEFNVYGDGVYMADHPLGPYTYAPNNPVSYKPGGFMNGAGHGSTVIGPGGNYWHFASMSLSYNVNWERRLCMYPTFFDKDGLMYCNTNFGDYPHFAPAEKGKQGAFTGWMLVSYKKPVKVSSEKEEHKAEHLTD
ncbi:MAG: family 43 glycosylhydrolase, partial [Chitinophagaceae bacterium]